MFKPSVMHQLFTHKHGIRLLLITLAILLLCGTMPSQAQQPLKFSEKKQDISSIFLSGYVNYTVPLSIFLPERMQVATSALRGRDMTVAEKLFVQETKTHPDDLAAYIGYLQSVPEKWDSLFANYQQEAASKPSAINEFRLGILAFYLAGGRQPSYLPPDQGVNGEVAAALALARRLLQNSFNRTKSPVAGFILAEALESTGGQVPVYNHVLRNLGGEAVYNAYTFAERRSWMAAQPPMPKILPDDLLIVSFVVHKIWASHSEQTGKPLVKIINGQRVESIQLDDYTPEQKLARSYLSLWEARLKTAASHTQ